ncbi:MAG: SpoIIE family protein phosphatase [Clostridia bacterium]|nr:SpoIIE family protein phosphatase [Clostridia bacterium]
MPDKSVRDMTEREQLHHSLSARVFRATLVGSVVLGLMALIVGLGAYTWSLLDQYTGVSFSIARSAAVAIRRTGNAEVLSMEVMDIYRSLSEEERMATGTEQYREHFAPLTKKWSYRIIMTVLREFREAGDVSDVYLGVYDRKTGALVYVCDPDDSPKTGFYIGEWEPLEVRELEKFLSWDGKGRLYDISYMTRYGWICSSGVPIGKNDDDYICFALTDITMGDVVSHIRRFVLQFAGILMVVIFLLGFFMTRHMRKTLVVPINAISAAAQSYVADRRKGHTDPDHFARLGIRTGDEVEKLSLAMSDMEHSLNEYEADLTRITAEQERIGTELSLAASIQEDVLPNRFPAFPDRNEFDIHAVMDPAQEVGGDFYDFYLIDEDHLALTIADVSDKGIPAALFMMSSKLILSNLVMLGHSPAAALEAANRSICATSHESMFVTVWLGILEISTGKLTAANAGHEYPFVMQAQGVFEEYRDVHGFVLGGLEDASYREYELWLKPGSKLFVYTDGLPEATGGAGQMFGLERVGKVLNASVDRSAEGVLENMRQAVNRFVSGAPQFDDLTMLCLEYRGGGRPMKEWKLEARVESIPTVTGYIDEQLEAIDCPMKVQMQIDIAIDELFGNIAHYAYPDGVGEAVVRFDFDEQKREICLVFSDWGIPYNPLKAVEPDVTLSAEERKVGGLGIFLVRKTMDEMTYEYSNGQNILTIRKRI